jgi:hypothetical protein
MKTGSSSVFHCISAMFEKVKTNVKLVFWGFALSLHARARQRRRRRRKELLRCAMTSESFDESLGCMLRGCMRKVKCRPFWSSDSEIRPKQNHNWMPVWGTGTRPHGVQNYRILVIHLWFCFGLISESDDQNGTTLDLSHTPKHTP